MTDGKSADRDTVALPRPRSGPGSGAPAARKGTRKPSRNRLTGRAGILALTLCAVMVTVAYPLRQYLAQRSQIANLRHQNQVTQQQVASLQSELNKWSDPAYVAIQARERLHYVRPGETGYTVPNSSASSEPLGIPSPTQSAWYDRLWSTVKSPAPSPSPSPTQ
jgi:cell division protein FtsB